MLGQSRMANRGSICSARKYLRTVFLDSPVHVCAGCSTRARRRNRNSRGSNRHWMKVQWQVTDKFDTTVHPHCHVEIMRRGHDGFAALKRALTVAALAPVANTISVGGILLTTAYSDRLPSIRCAAPGHHWPQLLYKYLCPPRELVVTTIHDAKRHGMACHAW